MNTTLRKKKKTIMDRASTMTSEKLTKEINRRLNGIMSGYVKGPELERLKSEATALARMRLRRQGAKII